MAIHTIAGIYEIVNSINGRRYIGSSINMRQRWFDHRKMLRRGNHKNLPLQSAWNKYGECNFIFRPIAILELDEVQPTEQRLLDSLIGIEKLYNIAVDVTSGMKGRSHSAETKEILSKKHLQYFSDPEVRSRHAEMKKIHGADPIVRQRISDSVKRYHQTDGAKQRNSDAQKIAQNKSEVIAMKREIAKLFYELNPNAAKDHSKKIKIYYENDINRLEQVDRMKMFYQTPEGKDCIERMRQSKLGKKHSEETKEKMRLASPRRKQSPESLAKFKETILARKRN